MVYKVFGKIGKARLLYHWKKEDELSCVIDNTFEIFGDYVFDFRNYSYADIKEFFDIKNPDEKLIYLYSNSTYLELRDFIEFLETLNHNFVLFIQE